jgi:hypothetical protein
MERGLIVREYFQLREFMNRANTRPNHTTNMKFEIELNRSNEYTLFAISSGKIETYRLAIAVRGGNRSWERAGTTQFQKLEQFCADFLERFEHDQSTTGRSARLSDGFKQRLEKEISSHLKMLKKSYEP